MSDPFIGEIKIVAFNFPPRGGALCNGQLLPINQNQALFSILGTMYGGNGVTNFALPNLQGRMPVHQGNGMTVGSTGGEAAHNLTVKDIPAPPLPGTSPAGALWATAPANAFAPNPNVAMSPAAIANAGSSQPHENQAP